MTNGEVGVWNGPKNDDVIYEQPLIIGRVVFGQVVVWDLVLLPGKMGAWRH